MQKPSERLDTIHGIVAVIPAFNEERGIAEVLQGIPKYFSSIIVVDDASSDRTAAIVEQLASIDSRIILIRHTKNRGVGGATVSGFHQALALDAKIIVKIDGDGQMPLQFLPNLLLPLALGQADYSKGNRFHDFEALKQMPALRRAGNMALSFLAKCVTGYWDLFDPTNGFFAIRGDTLRLLHLEKLDPSYFFEHSLLIQLYLVRAAVREVSMPAQYLGETSHLRISLVLFSFPPKLIRAFFRRILLKNFLFDFTMASIYILTGVPLLLFGLLFGGYKWVYYATRDIGAPTGTVVVPTLCVLLAVQFLLAAIDIDLRSVPKQPVNNEPYL